MHNYRLEIDEQIKIILYIRQEVESIQMYYKSWSVIKPIINENGIWLML